MKTEKQFFQSWVFYSQSIENKAAPGHTQVSVVNLRKIKIKTTWRATTRITEQKTICSVRWLKNISEWKWLLNNMFFNNIDKFVKTPVFVVLSWIKEHTLKWNHSECLQSTICSRPQLSFFVWLFGQKRTKLWIPVHVRLKRLCCNESLEIFFPTLCFSQIHVLLKKINYFYI